MSDVIPLLVRLMHGRCGSTLLMQLLCSNKNVICEKEYPYESRYLTYIDKISKLWNTERSEKWNDGALLTSDGSYLGSLPYKATIFDKGLISQRMFLSSLRVFLNNIKMHNENTLKVGVPIYYPEKISNDTADRISSNISSKNIYLIRDPRDIFISIRSFNEKRGSSDFGWKKGQSEAEYAIWICQSFLPFFKKFNALEEDENQIKIRYEDIILKPQITTDKLSTWLGIKLDYQFVIDNAQKMTLHMTAKSNSDSLSRWKNELSQELKLIFDELLGEELIKAGY